MRREIGASNINPETLRIFRLAVSELDAIGFEMVLRQLEEEIRFRLGPGSFRWLFRSLNTMDLFLLRQFLKKEKEARLQDGVRYLKELLEVG